MKITFADYKLPASGAVIIFAAESSKLLKAGGDLDKATGGALKTAIAADRFEGKKAEWLQVLGADAKRSRILIAGLGGKDDLKPLNIQKLGGQAFQRLGRSGVSKVSVVVDTSDARIMAADQLAAEFALGAKLASYRFEKYRTKQKPDELPSLGTMSIAVAGAAKARKSFAAAEQVAEGVALTRNLVSEPGNVLYPETFAKACSDLKSFGLKVEVLGEAQMRKLGMGALLGVGQGSARESKLAIMRWNGGKRGAAPVAFVGKGVTFDTGGISLKPPAGMEEMIWDMGGAGTVVGLMRALAGRKAKVNAIGVIGCVENMPSGKAQRPGDIVTSMSGQTIAVYNTDAEGRLVLADALWYTQKRFKPTFMIDLATLTGAMIIALGHEHAGLFGNNDELCERISAAGGAVGEAVWRMPLSAAYDKTLNNDAADMQNIGTSRGAGSIVAAQFLQRFVNEVPWAHLDIAGVAWSKSAKPTTPKGATGWGVRLLDRLVADHYEN